ncbi:GntR family transcriptional regulator [Parasphingopyxis lamellibrachiae]|uniref:GntR family transcriptional regulator n=1 Tax=Parasphingopyxis lamellibrachiae TaxID=680125 RepID=A0A3D9F890_9SPHN|nr:GntR family transcriptional regulator [Parasphingopyxis lamellibrachiae]RED13345.1 GntR family transcriptional regulator [Parasphingopyxis lamellibrachiae]
MATTFINIESDTKLNTLSEFIKKRSPEKSVADALADIFRKRIMDGDYLPGARLVEADLTKLYGVSRGPVREAIRRLAAEGLVDAEKHRSPMVRGVDQQKFGRMFEVRAILEAYSAKLAAQKVNSAHRKWITQEKEKWEKFTYCDDIDTFVSANTEFHDHILVIADHDVLNEQTRQLAIPGYKAVFKPLLRETEMRRSSLQHVEILQAILDGKADKAERLMRKHVEASGVRLTKKFSADLFDRRLHELEKLQAD